MKTKNFLFSILISLLFCLQSNAIKADTISVYLPTPPQTLCQSSGFDTFIFYKAPGFGFTMWYINFGYVGAGDSIVFTPATVGTFDISSTWNSNWVTTGLILYGSAPAHANFTMTGNGQINAAKDTIWMCGSSISLASNTTGSEATSYVWHGPSGFTPNSSDDPIPLSIPGWYYFIRPNPCDTTIDSLLLIQPVNTLPNLGIADTSLCNPALGTTVTIDAGAGFDHYAWSTTETTQSVVIDTSGTYTVSVTNACINGSVSKTVHYESYPTSYLGIDSTTCFGNSIQLKPHPTYVYTTTSWSDGSHLQTLDVTETGTFNVTVTQGACVEISNTVNLTFKHPYDNTVFCIATVDPLTAHIKTYFENTQNMNTASYNIYRENGGYLLLGNVLATAASSLEFLDVTSNASQQAYRYKVSAVDSCGNESMLSVYHSTLKVNSNFGVGSVVNIDVAEHYLVENMSYTPDWYYIYIDSTDNGSLHLMDSIPGYLNAYTVTSPFLGATYLFGIKPPWAGCSGAKSLGNNVALSNKSALVTGILATPKLDVSISLYPNPSYDGIFTIKGVVDNDHAKITVTDLSGRTILITEQTTLDLSLYATGVYSINVLTVSGSTNFKLILAK